MSPNDVNEDTDATSQPPKRLSNIEARRNCYLAMPRILRNVSSHLTYRKTPLVSVRRALPLTILVTDLDADTVRNMFKSLLQGLSDYSMDERGDVGSWIRIACIEGLASFLDTLITRAHDIPNFEGYLPPEYFHAAIGGILKQGVERLDGVRQEAGNRFQLLLQLSAPDIPSGDMWRIHSQSLMQQLFLRCV